MISLRSEMRNRGDEFDCLPRKVEWSRQKYYFSATKPAKRVRAFCKDVFVRKHYRRIFSNFNFDLINQTRSTPVSV